MVEYRSGLLTMTQPIYILRKLNFYIHNSQKNIIHPINTSEKYIAILTNKGLKTIDRLKILSDNIDDILDICSIEYMDKLL